MIQIPNKIINIETKSKSDLFEEINLRDTIIIDGINRGEVLSHKATQRYYDNGNPVKNIHGENIWDWQIILQDGHLDRIYSNIYDQNNFECIYYWKPKKRSTNGRI